MTGFNSKQQMAADKINSDFDEEYKKMHEDRIKYGTSWEKDGERIDPMSVYKEPAQEPVAWVNIGNLQGLTLGHYSHVEIYTDESAGRTPLYTAPPQRKPLTKEQIRKIVAELIEGVTVSEAVLFHSVARAIEAAHDIKENT